MNKETVIVFASITAMLLAGCTGTTFSETRVCGDGTCIDGVENNPLLPTYCPMDCGATTVPGEAIQGTAAGISAGIKKMQKPVEASLAIESIEEKGNWVVSFSALCIDYEGTSLFAGVEKCTLDFGDGTTREITKQELEESPAGVGITHEYLASEAGYTAALEAQNANNKAFEVQKEVKME